MLACSSPTFVRWRAQGTVTPSQPAGSGLGRPSDVGAGELVVLLGADHKLGVRRRDAILGEAVEELREGRVVGLWRW